MGRIFETIDAKLRSWIEAREMFFVATAPNSTNGLVNCSPKGLDSFRVLKPTRVAYLDLTGSGIETIAHLKANGRIVVMFCAFGGPPRIVRIHGQGVVHEPGSQAFENLVHEFPNLPGVRAVIDIQTTRIGDSCGYGVPRMNLVGQRDTLIQSTEKGGQKKWTNTGSRKTASASMACPDWISRRRTTMGDVRSHRPVMLIAAVVSRFDEAFEWSREKTIAAWGDIQMESPRFDFVETEFYLKSMGTDLKKQFFAYSKLINPADIAGKKITSNDLELEYSEAFQTSVERPLNIDPGYISEAKLVLATTKDRDHRIYLQQGIFAEVTLHYHHRKWRSSRWTYPDYQREDFQDFFTECRQHLRQKYRTQ